MSDPTTISGPRVLISEPDHDWERIGEPFVNEGPQVLQNNGETFIVYSASGSWTDHYCLGLLRLTGCNPLDPKSWSKCRTPVFGGTGTVFSPGHASFVKSPDGREDWIIYHTARHRGAGWNRDINIKQFSWDIDGNPVFGYPESKGVPFPAPSE
jgi:GH43 family beta-xylosidase